MVEGNTMFIGGAPTWANACVGENGFPGYWEYAKGFSRAAVILIDAALQGRGLNNFVDELVYPVCFNMRHSVELRLKGAISELISIEKYRGHALEFDLVGSHDIGNIWNFFVEKSQKVDDRYKGVIDRLDIKISEFSEVDATGQTFRYPMNTVSQRHLVDVALINFVELKRNFSLLEKFLDELHYLNKYLCEEYAWGTFTKKLSRKNLFEIASFLPPRSKWKDESFCAIKNTIKKRYGIGSKELSESINRIETHFEFAPQIEMSVPLLGVVDADIEEYFFQWFKLHDLRPDTDPIEIVAFNEEADVMHQSMVRGFEIQAEVWEEVQPKLSPEKMAGLSALFYFALELDFSESYEHIFERNLREIKLAYSDSVNSFRSKYFHIFTKATVVNNVLRSLYFLGKSELADRLVVRYHLSIKFSWLDSARNGDLFLKKDYCGYS